MQKTNEGNRKNESNRRNDNVNLKELYKVGQRVEGKIVLFFKAGKEHPDQSALVELNQGGTALLLYSEILGYPTNKLQSLYTLGESVEASVIAIRPNKNRISLSLRPVLRQQLAARLERGNILEVTVVHRVNFGYFVDLGGGLEALLHNENLDQNFHNQKETFAVGEKTEVVVLSVEEDGNRIGVGRKQLFN
jgi:ribosomal protein S1